MKITKYAALVAMVAGCGYAHAGDGNPDMPRYYEEEAPVARPRVTERTVVEETVVHHGGNGCLPAIPYCANENVRCQLRPGPNEFTGTIALYSTHDDPRGPGFELRGPDTPGHGVLQGRLARLQSLGYCQDLPPAQVPVRGPVGPIGPEGVPPVNAGPAWPGRGR